MSHGSNPKQQLILRLFTGSLLLIASGLATCGFPTDQAVVAPVKAAATSDVLLGQEVAGPTQPFIGVAKQVKAAVVNISSVRKPNTKREGERGNPLFDDPFFVVFSERNLNGGCLRRAIVSRAWALE